MSSYQTNGAIIVVNGPIKMKREYGVRKEQVITSATDPWGISSTSSCSKGRDANYSWTSLYGMLRGIVEFTEEDIKEAEEIWERSWKVRVKRMEDE